MILTKSNERVLVVSSHEEQRRQISLWLKKRGCAVFTAHDTAEAARVIVDARPDIIVVSPDTRMIVPTGVVAIRFEEDEARFIRTLEWAIKAVSRRHD